MGKNMVIGLCVMVPCLLLALGFWIGWLAIPAESRYLAKYNWLQDASTYTPIALIGTGALVTFCWIGYNKWRDGKK